MNGKQKASRSLEEVHSSVDTTRHRGFRRKLFAFMGPAYLVSVGYMDPGNWATDIAGGSQYGYTLIWVLLMSNLMALLLQSLSARLGLVQGLDLAQASRHRFPRSVNFFLWVLAEIAIAATDLAEVIGMAIGLQLLFDLPLLIGVSITVLDTLLLLVLQQYGMRKMEAFILGLVGIIGISFIVELLLAQPSVTEIAKGFVPDIPDMDALYITIGIIGATVMPHNLYLHSSLVQTRKIDSSPRGIKEALKFNFIDTGIALNMALFVNAAILILAAAAFHSSGYKVEEIQDAHKLLEPLLGSSLAPVLFAVALIAAGQSSTLTGTLSGQIVMEGYLNLRIQPWLRRLITRMIAIIPAFFTIYIFGEQKTFDLLVLSQVILSMQLGFAVIPLIHFVSDKKSMGEFVIKPTVKILAWTCAVIILALNIYLLWDKFSSGFLESDNKTLFLCLTLPLILAVGSLLLYIILQPIFSSGKIFRKKETPHGASQGLSILPAGEYKKIAVTIDFSEIDNTAISHATSLGGKNAEYLLIHIVETAGARMMHSEISDMETLSDKANLEKYAAEMKEKGFRTEIALGYGDAKISIPEIIHSNNVNLLVMGAHGHRGLKDIVYGTIIDAVRHKVNIPVLILK